MSPSKTFNLPGLNFAFAVVADEALRRRLLRPGEGLLPFPGCFAVAAAEAAYRDGGDWHAGLLDYLRGNRDALEAFVASELPRVRMTHVEATYLAWLDVPAPSGWRTRRRRAAPPGWRCRPGPPSATRPTSASTSAVAGRPWTRRCAASSPSSGSAATPPSCRAAQRPDRRALCYTPRS